MSQEKPPFDVTRPRRAGRLALVAAALVSLVTEVAEAQQTTFYLDRAQISGAPDDGLVVWRTYVAEKTRFYGTTTLGYTLNPLRRETLSDNPNVVNRLEDPVSNQLLLHLAAGAEFAGRFGVSFSLPIILDQTGGQDPLGTQGNPTAVGEGLGRQSPVLGDLRLNAKVRAFQTDDRRFQIGGGVSIFVPTGNATNFGGDDQVTAHIYGTAEYDFGKFLVAGNIGPHFKPDSGILNTNGKLEVGTELRWAGGIFLPMRQGDVRLGGSLWGTTGLVSEPRTGSTFFGGRNTDFEWLGEIRVLFDKQHNLFFNGGGGTRLSGGYGAPDIRLLAQVGTYGGLFDFGPGQVSKPRREAPDVEMHDKDTDGDGYPDDIDECPTEKEDGLPPDPNDGCPAPKDRDKDGIPDDADKCPDQPEDKDGIMDGDGCPEVDADGDGIPDTEDACPLVPGVKSKDPKKNGCKEEHKKIVETAGGIQLLEPIQFDTGKSSIKPVSFAVLDEVVDVLKAHPAVRMGIYGHTDSRGAPAMNTALSKDRARSVLNYLAGKGIERKRLESNGFGPDKPIDTNDTEEGRAKNRRVEFKILE